MRSLLAVVALALAARQAQALATCAACSVIVGLVEEMAGTAGVPAPDSLSPDFACQLVGLCTNSSCVLWPTWPNVFSPTNCSGRGTAGNPCSDGGAVDDSSSPPDGLFAIAGVEARPAEGVSLTADFEALRGKRLEGKAAQVAPHAFSALLALHREEQALVAKEGRGFDFFEAMQMLARGIAGSALKANPALAGKAVGAVRDWPCDILNITCIADYVFDAHLPLADNDTDWFAGGYDYLVSDGFRGASWRGRDCNESDGTIYPGRRAVNGDAAYDSNCNGIFGTAPNGTSYEQLYCSGANAPMGLAILGDSMSAHFSIPPQFLNALSFPNLDNLTSLLPLLANEADWPQCSWSTGYRTTEGCPLSGVPMNSIYQRLWQQNHCMFRDFQNAGVNGARASDVATVIEESLKRNQTFDTPMLVFVAVIGNDVCNGHPGFASMTTPAEFQASTLQTLGLLQNKLPAGSHVAFLPLVDGRVLWNTMNDLVHPTGASYPAVYDALICNDCTPCWGWLNSNATDRNLTSALAANLSSTYETVIQHYSHQFTNFDMLYVDFNMDELIQEYVQQGGHAEDIIEPVDGFHASTLGHQLIAEAVWDYIVQNKPSWIPPTNPFNAQIEALFGDQGGY